jgi:hypothetical protein
VAFLLDPPHLGVHDVPVEASRNQDGASYLEGVDSEGDGDDVVEVEVVRMVHESKAPEVEHDDHAVSTQRAYHHDLLQRVRPCHEDPSANHLIGVTACAYVVLVEAHSQDGDVQLDHMQDDDGQ